jgi:hypothetical protein
MRYSHIHALSASHRRRYHMGDAQVAVIDADGEFL